MKFALAVLLSISITSIQSLPIKDDWNQDISIRQLITKEIFIRRAQQELESARLMVVDIVANTYEKIIPITNIGPIKLKIVTSKAQKIVDDLNNLGGVYKTCIDKYEPTITSLIKAAEDNLNTSIDGVTKANAEFHQKYQSGLGEIDSRIEKMPEFVAECEDGIFPNITPCFQKKHDEIKYFIRNVISTVMDSTSGPIQKSAAANANASEYRQKILEISNLAEVCYTETSY